MDVRETIVATIDHSGIPRYKLARAMDKSDLYISALLSRGSIPKTDTMATILDACGFDLLARNRDDGTEFIIDPPKR